MTTQIVWFKRDLRIVDHQALAQASQNGCIIPLYILEPELWKQPDLSYRHYAFLKECLEELGDQLKSLGQPLVIKVGDPVEVLNKIVIKYSVTDLWSHQETWNNWTYQRDKRVKKWIKKQNIKWHEPIQNGVIRLLKNRNGWSNFWYNQMNKPLQSSPYALQKIEISSDPLPSFEELGLSYDNCRMRQKGGRTEGLKILQNFLYERGESYTKEMSSPVTAYDSCSRISPYLAFGALSIREVFHAVEKKNKEIKLLPYGKKGKWSSAMRSFSGRLRWHCHFIQKLEDEPQIEFKNMHSAYDALRKHDFNETYFEAWKQGKTGYPMIDACMRALTATGWLNFRMRAMLMSFASYHLWLDWKRTGLHLAKLFVDYEPGIHYSQVQMQSGTTGINTIRIYNPIKQAIDHDPMGIFIRKWIPELSNVPTEYIHEPSNSSEFINKYPLPIVDQKVARKEAADKLYSLRKNIEYKQEAKAIYNKHGSRKSGRPKKIRNSSKNNLTSI